MLLKTRRGEGGGCAGAMAKAACSAWRDRGFIPNVSSRSFVNIKNYGEPQ